VDYGGQWAKSVFAITNSSNFRVMPNLRLTVPLAKVEAQKISERTRAGMSRAKAKGVKIGRPRLAAELRHEITRRAATGETAYAIAKALHIDRHTAAEIVVAISFRRSVGTPEVENLGKRFGGFVALENISPSVAASPTINPRTRGTTSSMIRCPGLDHLR
jgi:hypothetical protein